MYPVARPAGYQPFRVGYCRCSVLHDVALDVLPLTFTEGGVVLCTQVDGEDSILPENVSSQSSQPSHALVVHGLRDEVRLEEPNACGRQFNGVFEIGADQVVHPHHTLVGMLQDVDGGIVRVVSQHVAQGERMDDANEHILGERFHTASSQRLNGVSDLTQRQSSEARCGVRGQLDQHAGVDAVRTVCSRTDQSRQGLAQLIAQFFSNILYRIIDSGC